MKLFNFYANRQRTLDWFHCLGPIYALRVGIDSVSPDWVLKYIILTLQTYFHDKDQNYWLNELVNVVNTFWTSHCQDLKTLLVRNNKNNG